MTSAFCGARIKMRRMNCGVRFKKRTNAAATILGVVEKRQLESGLFVFDCQAGLVVPPEIPSFLVGNRL